MRTPEEWFTYHHRTKLWTPGEEPAVLQLLRLAMADAAGTERERCAAIADRHTATRGISEVVRGDDETAREIAARIRSLPASEPEGHACPNCDLERPGYCIRCGASLPARLA